MRRSSGTTRAASSASAPQFSRLIKAGFQSVGVGYVSVDHFRKAKKNVLSERERLELWKLLYDLVMLVLLNFQADIDEMRRVNSGQTLESTLLDPGDHAIRQELVRFYLFEWGFVCTPFFVVAAPPPDTVLLFATTWLLAHSRFFERQHREILQIYMSNATARLPPYPNTVVVSAEATESAMHEVAQSASALLTQVTMSGGNSVGVMHQIQSIAGRLHKHLKALQSYTRYYDRLLVRVAEQQQTELGADPDQVLPAYALQVFSKSKTVLEHHIQLLSERVQMLEDEQTFYKWINGIVMKLPRGELPSAEASRVLEDHYSVLDGEIRTTHNHFKENAALYHQIAVLYDGEWKKWKQKPKTRTQTTTMETKMEQFAHGVATTELWDSQRLFLEQNPKALEPSTALSMRDTVAPVSEQELEALTQQLDRVLKEITRDYCQVELV
ncbi:hypothetical protein Poli38472_010316 [Pythium oligandrum]|uniref:Tubulin epsilon and delta complex protein 1 domain-containing protein n=1 Tax=Pythium oligandrum TaxID=41045 RepID=A0A8K1C2T4_PYTOL|nr:hypothetical protein Poli38472_010316 [Pythium oligandrum]|eukprot:TMW55434.1 hypothetical protein Poli38472_010316 [Pythium oligandrum]